MQRFKTTILLASILGILIVATIGAAVVSKNKNTKKTAGDALVNVNISDVDKIEVNSNGKKQELVKASGEWVVSSSGNLKADQEAVNTMLDKIKEIKKDDVASNNPDNKASFEVDEKGVEVKLFKGADQLADFFVGKSGSDFNSTYVKAASDDNVYITKSFIRQYFDKDDFRDLKIFNFDKEKVSEIKLEQAGKDAVVLQKKDGAWKAQWYDKFDMDESKVNSLLSSLANLSAKDIVQDKDAASAGLNDPKIKASVKFEDGSEEAINIGDKLVSGDYYTKRSAADAIYTVPESTVQQLQKGKDDFAKQ